MLRNPLVLVILTVLVCLAATNQSFAQFGFRYVQSTSPLSNLDDALDLLNGQNVEFETRCYAAIFDLVDGDNFTTGRFNYDLNVMGIPGVAEDDFAIEVIADIEISKAGTYTFGFNLDDGGLIQIDFGKGFETIVERPVTGGTQDFYGQANFDSIGSYPIRIIYWDTFFQANIEVYSAFGKFTKFDSSMRLLGDVNNNGLKLIDRTLRGDVNCDGDVNLLDVAPFVDILSGG